MSTERKPLNGTISIITKYEVSRNGSSKSTKHITFIDGIAYPATEEEIKYSKCSFEMLCDLDPEDEEGYKMVEEFEKEKKEFRKRMGWE